MIQAFTQAHHASAWLKAQGCLALRSDSRRVQAGDGFVAWPGASYDARQAVAGVIRSGAAAALVDAQDLTPAWQSEWAHMPIATLPNLKHQSGWVASHFYHADQGQLPLLAVTGTNGKTSVTWWLAQALSHLNLTCGLAGTLGVGLPGELRATGLTTMQAVELHDALAHMQAKGWSACAIEASSIGIVEGRLNGTQIRVGVFTNLSQDHLDYHGDMHHYWQAKRELMRWPGLAHAVVNIDDAHGAELARTWDGHCELWTTSVNSPARLQACDVKATPTGMQFTVVEQTTDGQTACPLELSVAGVFNVSNVLQVLASLRAMDVSLQAAVSACAALTAVPGRLQPVNADAQGPQVWVDYAHTPDAVAQVLQALAPIAQARQGRIWCVLGCGGNRDQTKRAPMAQSAEQHAHHVVLTSDNPRDEAPEQILRDMEVGLSRRADWVGVDRAQAIAYAITHAKAEDVVVIAGKGHEDYQEVHGQRLPFNDTIVAQAACKLRAQSEGAA